MLINILDHIAIHAISIRQLPSGSDVRPIFRVLEMVPVPALSAKAGKRKKYTIPSIFQNAGIFSARLFTKATKKGFPIPF